MNTTDRSIGGRGGRGPRTIFLVAKHNFYNLLKIRNVNSDGVGPISLKEQLRKRSEFNVIIIRIQFNN